MEVSCVIDGGRMVRRAGCGRLLAGLALVLTGLLVPAPASADAACTPKLLPATRPKHGHVVPSGPDRGCCPGPSFSCHLTAI
jgi:hypothetical protein